MMHRIYTIALFSLFSQFLSLHAFAEHQDLNNARTLYGDLEYEKSMALLENLVASHERSKSLTKIDLITTYQFLGMIYILLGEEKQAEQAISKLYQLDRNFRIDPGYSPKIVDFFYQIKSKMPPPVVSMTGKPLATAQNEEIRFEVELTGEIFQIRTVNLYYRGRGLGEQFYQATMSPTVSGKFAVILPVFLRAGESVIEYYVVITDHNEKAVFTEGNQGSPLATPIVSPPKSTQQIKPAPKDKLWTGLAMGAATTAATLFLIFNNQDTRKKRQNYDVKIEIPAP
jgi:hypothetical protein